MTGKAHVVFTIEQSIRGDSEKIGSVFRASFQYLLQYLYPSWK